MINNIIPYLFKLMDETFCHCLFWCNQSKMYRKFIGQRIRKFCCKTLSTGVIYSPISQLFFNQFHRCVFCRWAACSNILPSTAVENPIINFATTLKVTKTIRIFPIKIGHPMHFYLFI